jgi:hypothetical protein
VSYDLAVYAPRALDDAELRALVEGTNGLAIDEAVPGSTTVVRGVRRRYAFTIDGPDRVEVEDVPSDVAAVVLGTRYLYSILVEGSTQSEVPHAIRFGRRLAQALEGAVTDPQEGEVWSRSKTRTVQKPAKAQRVATVNVRWYCLREVVDGNLAERYTTTVQRILPEALPRRFGEYEPLQNKYADGGAAAFAEAWAAASSTMYFSGSGPCEGGSLDPGPSARSQHRFWSMSLTLLAEPLRQAAWRDALRRLFVAFADELPAVYAQADVTDGWIWSGRSLWADGETRSHRPPVQWRDGWMGLPPSPVWWSWLGRPFDDFTASLPADRTTHGENGVLYEAATDLAGAESGDQLTRWLPSELFAVIAPNPPGQRSQAPLTRAVTIPASLASPPGEGHNARVETDHNS